MSTALKSFLDRCGFLVFLVHAAALVPARTALVQLIHDQWALACTPAEPQWNAARAPGHCWSKPTFEHWPRTVNRWFLQAALRRTRTWSTWGHPALKGEWVQCHGQLCWLISSYCCAALHWSWLMEQNYTTMVGTTAHISTQNPKRLVTEQCIGAHITQACSFHHFILAPELGGAC